MQLFKRDPPLNLKTELKKLIFDSKKNPLAICEDQVTFVMVMSTFMNYEKQVSVPSS